MTQSESLVHSEVTAAVTAVVKGGEKGVGRVVRAVVVANRMKRKYVGIIIAM